MWAQFQPVTEVDLPPWHYHLHSTPVSNPEMFHFWCQFSSWTSDSNCYSFLSASSVMKVSFVRVLEINVVCLLVSLTHVMWPAARTVCSHGCRCCPYQLSIRDIFLNTLVLSAYFVTFAKFWPFYSDSFCLDLPFYVDMFLQVGIGLWLWLFS